LASFTLVSEKLSRRRYAGVLPDPLDQNQLIAGRDDDPRRDDLSRASRRAAHDERDAEADALAADGEARPPVSLSSISNDWIQAMGRESMPASSQ
jgi:hypothetical protein